MAVAITIAGVNRLGNIRRDLLRITKDGHVERCALTTFSRDLTVGAYRPALGDVVRVTQDGALIFGGTVEDVQDAARDGLNRGATDVEVTALGYHLLPARLLVTATFAAGTTALEVAAYLFGLLNTYFGVSNLGAATGGPALPGITWDHVRASDAFDQLCQMASGAAGVPWIWRINGDKQGIVQAAGTDTGAAFTDANAKVIGGFSWRRSRAQRATRCWAKIGAAGVGATAYTQTWTGNGSRVNFYANIAPDFAPTQVTEGATVYAVPSATWTWNATRGRLQRATALGNGVVLSCAFTATYPIYCRAETEASVDAGDLHELPYDYPDVLDVTQGIALAAGHLSQQAETPKRVSLQTREVNVYPWQKCNLSFAARTISGDYFVRRVEIAPAKVRASGASTLLYDVELWEKAGRSWMDWWKSAVGSGGASGTAIAGGGVAIYNVTGQAAPVHFGGGENVRTNVATASTWVRGFNGGEVIFDSSKMPGTIKLDLLMRADPITGGNAQARVVAGSGDWTDQTVVSGTVTPVTDSAAWVYQEVTITLRAGVYAYRIEMTSSVNNSKPGFRAYLRW